MSGRPTCWPATWIPDADWDNYLNELNNIGLEELIEVYQTVYDRMYK